MAPKDAMSPKVATLLEKMRVTAANKANEKAVKAAALAAAKAAESLRNATAKKAADKAFLKAIGGKSTLRRWRRAGI